MARCAEELADAISAAIGPWVLRSVDRIAEAWRTGLADDLRPAAVSAAEAATTEIGAAVGALLAMDVDEQHTGPLDLVRGAVRHPTEVLAAAGVPPVVRDGFAEERFPDDAYDLTPGSFGDIDASVHGPGLAWGAAKAHVVLARRRAEGRR